LCAVPHSKRTHTTLTTRRLHHQAFAELNILLGRYLSESGSMPDALLRGYHSFTLQPRAALWQVRRREALA
jgi:hypothetical protein